jgi:L-2-hydroxyglutarate oxidase LhgO
MTDVTHVETVVVGAGVVGLAIGAEIARLGGQPFILESASAFGTGISSRNSEVIHSGVYYPENSLKCRLCVEGRKLLYAYCDSRGIAYRKCGKLIVATADRDLSKIEALARQAMLNDVNEAELIDERQTRKLEPELTARGALHLTETGIVDSHAYMQALCHDIESAGGAVVPRHEVIGGRCAPGDFELHLKAPSGHFKIKARRLVLSAGLMSHQLAARLEGYDLASLPPLTLAKGSYFAYRGKPAFSRLIYPAPVDGGLGTHLTLDLTGRMRFGPDVEWLDTTDPGQIDFTVEPGRALLFYDAIRRYWPKLPDDSLVPDYSGVRPKLSSPGQPAEDFMFHGPEDHGIPGLIALYGIESPGLTSSLAIARKAAGIIM